MQTDVILFRRPRIIDVFFLVNFLLFSVIGSAQKTKEISISAYPGFTLVNFEEALGYSDEYMEDWSEIHLSAAIRGFLFSEKPFHLGAEIAWQRLYYAYYVVPYEPSSVYREFNVTTISFMALGRYFVDKFFAAAGAGIHVFNDGVAPAVCLEAGYMIKAGENLKFPLSLRINPVFASGTPIPFSVGAGVSYTFR